MRMIRGRREARWLPSRHNFALFRLFGFLRSHAARPEPAEVILIVDRDQSSVENFSVAAGILLCLTCYLAATLFASWPIAAALAVSLPLALVVVELPFLLLAPLCSVFQGERRLRAQSAAMMFLFLAASAWVAGSDSWARFAAWAVLATAVLNAAAAALLFLLRDRVARLESALGGTVSAL